MVGRRILCTPVQIYYTDHNETSKLQHRTVFYLQHYTVSHCQHPLQSVTTYVRSAGLKVTIQYDFMNHYDFCNTGKGKSSVSAEHIVFLLAWLHVSD
jgi:hypothetical protein